MAKPIDLSTLTATQLEVMNVIWEGGEVSVTHVWSAIRKERKVARSTIQTLIQRLEDKGWLTHREIGQAFVYSARHPRDTAQGKLVADLVDWAFSGSTAGLVKALLNDRKLSSEEAERIRGMIAAAEHRTGARKSKKRK